MSRAYLAFTEKGMALAHRLARALPGSVSRCGAGGVRLAEWTSTQFAQADALIFVGAVGIAVRAIAPHCKSKATDPAVVVLDECGRFAVPLLSAGLAGTHPQQPDSSMTRASNGMSFFMELGPPSVFILCLIYSIRWGLILQLQMCYKKQQKRAENAACRRGRRHFSVFILFTPWKRRIPPVWPGGPGAFQPGPARPPPRGRGPC